MQLITINQIVLVNQHTLHTTTHLQLLPFVVLQQTVRFNAWIQSIHTALRQTLTKHNSIFCCLEDVQDMSHKYSSQGGVCSAQTKLYGNGGVLNTLLLCYTSVATGEADESIIG